MRMPSREAALVPPPGDLLRRLCASIDLVVQLGGCGGVVAAAVPAGVGEEGEVGSPGGIGQDGLGHPGVAGTGRVEVEVLGLEGDVAVLLDKRWGGGDGRVGVGRKRGRGGRGGGGGRGAADR